MKNKIMIVGEAWGENEEREQTAFVGPSGHELTKMLSEANIHRADCFLTNVFNLRPERNDIEKLCGPKTTSIPSMPSIRPGKFVRDEYAGQLARLHNEVLEVLPNVILALGNTACWALLLSTAISKIRGTVTTTTKTYAARKIKVLPAYHPAAILREWSNRHVTVLDFMKAERESHFPEVRRPKRTIYIEPTLEDLEWYYDNFLRDARIISFDIETMGTQITCIGFSPAVDSALVIPFHDPRKTDAGREQSYWGSAGEELAAWAFVRKVLDLPCPKVGQNLLYDTYFLWVSYGIPVRNVEHDTMLLHHSLHPESQKGLGFLGSVYTNESSWKLIRARGKTTIKRED